MIASFVSPRGTASTMLQYGFYNMIANWPVLALRICVTLLTVFIGTLLTAKIGFSVFDLSTFNVHTLDLLKQRNMLGILMVLALVVMVGAAALAVDSYVSAASVRVYLQAQNAALVALPHRSLAVFRVFRFWEWNAAGRASWWRLFQVKLVTGLSTLILVAPFAVFGIENAGKHPGILAFGCISIVVLPIPLIRVALWGLKAEVVCIAVPEASVRETLRAGWSVLMANYRVHLVTALIVALIAIAVGVLFAAGVHRFGVAEPISHAATKALSTVLLCWLVASFVALTERA